MEISICSEAYLSRNATPKNNTMTPKRTNVLPPKKKFHSADGSAGALGAVEGIPLGCGESTGSCTSLVATVSGCAATGLADGGVGIIGGTVGAVTAGAPAPTGSPDSPAAAGAESPWAVVRCSLSRKLTRCWSRRTADSSVSSRSIPGPRNFCDSAQPAPAPAIAPSTTPPTPPIAPMIAPMIKPKNHMTHLHIRRR